MRRPDKDMQLVREQIAELINEDMQVMSIRYTAGEVAKMVGVGKATVTTIFREFGLTTDGYVWYVKEPK